MAGAASARMLLRNFLCATPAICFVHAGRVVIGGLALGASVADEFIPEPCREDGSEDAATDPELVVSASFYLALRLNLRIPSRLLRKFSIPLLSGLFTLAQLRWGRLCSRGRLSGRMY